jgi:hypothetical protein
LCGVFELGVLRDWNCPLSWPKKSLMDCRPPLNRESQIMCGVRTNLWRSISVAITGKIWDESIVPVFIERFLMVVCAAAFYGFVLNNAMSLDIHQRISLGLVLVGAAYFLGHTSYKKVHPVSPSPSVQQRATPAESPRGTGDASATGACNAVNSGNGGKVDVNCGDAPQNEKKKQ